jgi:hypothetical protein
MLFGIIIPCILQVASNTRSRPHTGRFHAYCTEVKEVLEVVYILSANFWVGLCAMLVFNLVKLDITLELKRLCKTTN